MSERDIREWLEIGEDYRKIIEACEKTPRSASEIAKIVGLPPAECSKKLASLENCKAIERTKEGWKSTSIAISVLDKYFR